MLFLYQNDKLQALSLVQVFFVLARLKIQKLLFLRSMANFHPHNVRTGEPVLLWPVWVCTSTLHYSFFKILFNFLLYWKIKFKIIKVKKFFIFVSFLFFYLPFGTGNNINEVQIVAGPKGKVKKRKRNKDEEFFDFNNFEFNCSI